MVYYKYIKKRRTAWDRIREYRKYKSITVKRV